MASSNRCIFCFLLIWLKFWSIWNRESAIMAWLTRFSNIVARVRMQISSMCLCFSRGMVVSSLRSALSSPVVSQPVRSPTSNNCATYYSICRFYSFCRSPSVRVRGKTLLKCEWLLMAAVCQESLEVSKAASKPATLWKANPGNSVHGSSLLPVTLHCFSPILCMWSASVGLPPLIRSVAVGFSLPCLLTV